MFRKIRIVLVLHVARSQMLRMNARLSLGNISDEGIIVCPFHGARFDAITGKKTKEPVLMSEEEVNTFLENKLNLQIGTIDDDGDPNIQPV